MQQQLFKLAVLARDSGRCLAAMEICRATNGHGCTCESCIENDDCEYLAKYNKLAAEVILQVNKLSNPLTLKPKAKIYVLLWKPCGEYHYRYHSTFKTDVDANTEALKNGREVPLPPREHHGQPIFKTSGDEGDFLVLEDELRA